MSLEKAIPHILIVSPVYIYMSQNVSWRFPTESLCVFFLRYATSRKVAGSSPDEVIGFFFSINLMLPFAPRPRGLLSLEQKLIPEDISGDKARPVRKVDNLTAIYEPVV
jgi:hypothetical protein